MAKTEDVKKELQKSELSTMQSMISKNIDALGDLLPEQMRDKRRLGRLAMITLRKNPKLLKADPYTFMGALFQAAQLGLEIDVNGQCFILPYRSKKSRYEYEANFQVGYPGYLELYYRHEKSGYIQWDVVKENDIFEWEKGTNAHLTHKPADEEQRGKTTHYWVMATLKDGWEPFAVMTAKACMDHGKRYSKCYDKKNNRFYPDSSWNTSPDIMCLKTVWIQLCKVLPKSVQIKQALDMDNTIKRLDDKGVQELKDAGGDMSGVPDGTNWAEVIGGEPKETEVEIVNEPKQKPKHGKPTKKDIENMTVAERRAAEKAEEEAFMRSEEVKL